MKIKASELKIGDVVNTIGSKVRIVAFREYVGPLSHLWPEGARIATFDKGPGMTMPNGDWFETTSFAA